MHTSRGTWLGAWLTLVCAGCGNDGTELSMVSRPALSVTGDSASRSFTLSLVSAGPSCPKITDAVATAGGIVLKQSSTGGRYSGLGLPNPLAPRPNCNSIDYGDGPDSGIDFEADDLLVKVAQGATEISMHVSGFCRLRSLSRVSPAGDVLQAGDHVVLQWSLPSDVQSPQVTLWQESLPDGGDKGTSKDPYLAAGIASDGGTVEFDLPPTPLRGAGHVSVIATAGALVSSCTASSCEATCDGALQEVNQTFDVTFQ